MTAHVDGMRPVGTATSYFLSRQSGLKHNRLVKLKRQPGQHP